MLNYRAPLKSLRTRQEIMIYEPAKISFDGSIGSDEGQRTPREGDVKRPAISFVWENAPGKPKIEEKEDVIVSAAGLKPPPYSLSLSKAKDSDICPPPAGTPPENLNLLASHPPKASAPPSVSTVPNQSQAIDVPVQQFDSIAPPPARRSSTPTRSQQLRSNGVSRNDGLRTHVEREREGARIAERRDMALDRHYSSERLRQAPPVQDDLYVPTRNAPSDPAINSSYATQAISRLATHPDSHGSSEAANHNSAEWRDEHISDAGEIYSEMDHYQAQCQVSVLDGCRESDLQETYSHTDPRARDFIMQRFLPAAKAMVTESGEANERRSPDDTPSSSPSKGIRTLATVRSRFAAFKQQFDVDEEEIEEEEEDQGMLFKCKFPWQVSPFGSLCLPGPAPQPGDTRGKGDRRKEEEMDAAWTYSETEGSESKDENRWSIEIKGPSTTFRTRSGSSTNTNEGMAFHQRDQDNLDPSQSFSVDSQSGELSKRSDDSRLGYGSVPKDRLHGTNLRQSPPPRRKPEQEVSGDLGMRTSNQTPTMVQTGHRMDVEKADAREQVIADSSILNDHRHKSRQQSMSSLSPPELRAREGDLGQSQSSAHGSSFASSQTRPNANRHDDGDNYSRHFKQPLYKQDVGDSRRSLESIDDETWEAIDREPTSSDLKSRRQDYYGQQRSDRFGLASTAPGIPDNADDARAVGWPLGKAYSALSRVSTNESRNETASSKPTDSKLDSYSRTSSTDSRHGSALRAVVMESRTDSAYTRTASNESKHASSYARTSSSDSKHESNTPTTNSKNESFSSFSTQSPTSHVTQDDSSSERFSPVSVFQPPLLKAPSESWLGKFIPSAQTPVFNWQQTGAKMSSEHSVAKASRDVQSESAQVRNLMLVQDSHFSTKTASYGGR